MTNGFVLFFLPVFLQVFAWNSTHAEVARPPRPSYYVERYELYDLWTKRVDNFGDGFLPLYGVRNFRAVLNGHLYRGGANNYFHNVHKRDNRNPLPDDGLGNLCEEGFSQAVYLYSTNFDTAPHEVSCESIGGKNHLKYLQQSPFNTEGRHHILEAIYKNLKGARRGPIYLHCWNGWHASGFISALALRQFCDFTPDEAVAYWDRNTDGFNKDPAFVKVRADIKSFVPYKDFQVSHKIQSEVCLSPELK